MRLGVLALGLALGVGGATTVGRAGASLASSVQPIQWNLSAKSIVDSLCPDTYPHPLQGLQAPVGSPAAPSPSL